MVVMDIPLRARKLPGSGFRYAYDDFKFSLWDVNAHDYRRPSNAEQEDIFQKYSAPIRQISVAFIFVSTLNPPKDIALIIGGATACFVSSDTYKAGWSPLLPSGNANYANPRVNNPCSNIPLKRWTIHSPVDTTEVVNALLEICNVQSLKFHIHTLWLYYGKMAEVIRSDHCLG